MDISPSRSRVMKPSHSPPPLPSPPQYAFAGARFLFQMILKAVDAAAPSRERSAWYERRSHWEGTARRRQQTADRARAATAARSTVHAQAAAVSRHGVPRRQGTAEAGGRGGGGEDEEGGGGRDGFRLNKMQAVLAVAVMLVMAVMKLRGFKR